MKTKLILLDIHGCVHHPYTTGNYDGKPHKEWVIQENTLLMDTILRDLKENGYEKIIIGYGTNAQDKRSDISNYARGGSITKAIPIIQSYLSLQLKQEILFEPFTMPDIYGGNRGSLEKPRSLSRRNLESGQNFKDLIEGRPHTEYAAWVFDHSKVSLVYAFAHRVAHLHPNDDIDIDFYDDTKMILMGLAVYFNQTPELLPSSIRLNLIQYNGENLEFMRTIQGSGELDKHYDWTVRLFSAKSYFFNSGASEGNQIKTALELKSYHEDYHYDKPGRQMEMDGSKVDPQELLKIRDKEISKLASNPLLLKSNYVSSLVPVIYKPSVFIEIEETGTKVKRLRGYSTLPCSEKKGMDFIHNEIQRLDANSKKCFSFGNLKKITLIKKAVKKAKDAGCEEADIQRNLEVQKALAHHRIFGFFGCKKTTATLKNELSLKRT